MTQSTQHPKRALHFSASRPLAGSISVPGDKSISHRAILFGLLAEGETTIDGWLDAADCRSSLRVARQLGAGITEVDNGLTIRGTGGQLSEPADVLDCGNSGTTIRLFLGALAARVPFACVTGDDSLRSRPMGRVIEPLKMMGAWIHARSATYAPLAVTGHPLVGITYTVPMASAQVKSAIVLAGLLARHGTTEVTEPLLSRDHTESMLQAFGATLDIEQTGLGQTIRVQSGQRLHGTHVSVPGDISSAAFLLAAACLVPNSSVTITGVGLNPTRTGFLRVLQKMGGDLQISNVRTVAGEAVGDVTATYSPLRGVSITSDEIPALIDELPLIAVLAAFATGTTEIHGASELRVKETDRIAAVIRGLHQIGVAAREYEDGFAVNGGDMVRGGTVDSMNDHRIAMSFAVAGLRARDGVTVLDWDCVRISYPQFSTSIETIGGVVEEVTEVDVPFQR